MAVVKYVVLVWTVFAVFSPIRAAGEGDENAVAVEGTANAATANANAAETNANSALASANAAASDFTGAITKAGSDVGAGLMDTYNDIVAIKTKEFQLATEVLYGSIGLTARFIGRLINTVAIAADVTRAGLGSVRSLTESGAGFVVDGAQQGLTAASSALTTAGDAAKDFGKGYIPSKRK